MNNLNFTRLLTKYAVGFGAALMLSILSFLIVTNQWFESAYVTMAVIFGLAVVQMLVQLICFLHLGLKGRSTGRSVTLIFTMLMMLVVVVGSIWIMRNLDYRMGTSSEAMNEYMEQQNKKGF